jgi:pyridoxamine 5'-phosphate oxidase
MKKNFQSPQEIRQQIWKELGRASQDRHHAWRTPVLATTGTDGTVNARTVVLRSADLASQTLKIYTDRRSPKVQELTNEPNALFVFWSPRLSWQLRVRVSFSNQASSSQVEAQWQRVKQTASATDYLSPLAPGSPCVEGHSAYTLPEEANNFTLLIAQVLEIDWLELGRAQHRRARLLQNHWQWLTP